MMNKYRLMSPGPTPIPPEVSAAGALPIIHHRTPEFSEVFTRVNENLKRVFLTENDIFTYAASGTWRGVRRIQLSWQVPTGLCVGSTMNTSQNSVVSSSRSRK